MTRRVCKMLRGCPKLASCDWLILAPAPRIIISRWICGNYSWNVNNVWVSQSMFLSFTITKRQILQQQKQDCQGQKILQMFGLMVYRLIEMGDSHCESSFRIHSWIINWIFRWLLHGSFGKCLISLNNLIRQKREENKELMHVWGIM